MARPHLMIGVSIKSCHRSKVGKSPTQKVPHLLISLTLHIHRRGKGVVHGPSLCRRQNKVTHRSALHVNISHTNSSLSQDSPLKPILQITTKKMFAQRRPDPAAVRQELKRNIVYFTATVLVVRAAPIIISFLQARRA